MIVRELLVRLGVIADPAKVKDFDDAIDDLKANMGALVGVAKQVVAAGAAVGAMLGLQAVATAESTLEIERQAAALGLSTDAYQEWRAATGAFNVDAKDLADGFGQVAQVIGQAQEGSKGAVETFRSLDIAVSTLKGKSVEEVFYLIADGLQRTTDDGDRLRAANTLLGEQLARQLLPLLIQGSAGIDRYRREARALGAVMDGDTIAKGKEAAQAFARFGIILQGVRNELGIAFLPVMTQLAYVFGEWLADNRELIGARLADAVVRIQDAIEALTTTVYRVNDAVRESFGGWGNVLERIKSLVVVLATAQAWRTLVSAVTAVRAGFATLTAAGGLLAGASLSTVLGWAVALAAALVALYLVVDDLWTYWRGGESVIGDFLASSERARATLGALGEAARAVGVLLGSMFDALRTFANILLPLLGPLLPMLQGVADGFIRVFGNQALASLRAFTAGLAFLAEMIQFTTGSIADLVALVKGEAGLGEILDRFGGRAGELAGAGGRMVGQGMLALPGLGSLTAGGKAASRGGIYVPATAPTTLPTAAPTPTVMTTNSVGGNTYNISGVGMDLRAVEEFSYRNDQVQGRQLAALSGAGS